GVFVGFRQRRDDRVDRARPGLFELGDGLLRFRSHEIGGRLDLLDQSVGTQVGEKTHSAVLMLLQGLSLPQSFAHTFQWPSGSKQAGIMPCLPAATAVLAGFGVTESMAISEASVRAALESYIDPYLQQSLAQASALRAMELHADRVLAKIELGFPTVGYTHSLQSALQRHLAAAGLEVQLTLELASRIVPHAVQRNLKPLAGVK